MSTLIKVHEFADGTPMPAPGPFWVESFNADSPPYTNLASIVHRDGLIVNGVFGGTIALTNKRRMARRFDNLAEAIKAWNTVSQTMPKRPDGKPNKPLTAMTVEFEPE